MNGNVTDIIVSQPMMASLLLEGTKYALRRWILADPNYDFPLQVYSILLPVYQIISVPLLVWLGFMTSYPEHIDFSSAEAGFRTLLVAIVQSLISVFWYNNTVSPIKTEASIRNIESEIKSALAIAEDGAGDGHLREDSEGS